MKRRDLQASGKTCSWFNYSYYLHMIQEMSSSLFDKASKYKDLSASKKFQTIYFKKPDTSFPLSLKKLMARKGFNLPLIFLNCSCTQEKAKKRIAKHIH